VAAYYYFVPTHGDAERALRRTLARLREDPSLVEKYVVAEYHRDIVRRYISCIAVNVPVRFVDSDLRFFYCRVAAAHCPEVDAVVVSIRLIRPGALTRWEALIYGFSVLRREQK